MHDVFRVTHAKHSSFVFHENCGSLCTSLSDPAAAMLTIHPNRQQFFWYDPVNLTCTVPENSGVWILRRNTSTQTSEPCEPGWGLSDKTSCTIGSTYPLDSGVYWCQSEHGECSNTINITVTGKCNLEI